MEGASPAVSKRRANAGFTLIEVLTVVFLLGVFAIVAQPALNSSVDHAKLSAAAGEVATAIKFAQTTAVTTGQSCRVTVDASADTLAVEQLTSAADFSDPTLSEISRGSAESISYRLVGHPINRGKSYSLDFKRTTGFGGVDVVSAVFGSGSSVTFDGLGAPSDGGVVTLERGGRLATVSVDGVSGKVTVSGL